MYRNAWLVVVLALVVGISVVPAVQAGSVVVEQRIAPSVSADYTIRDARTLRPRPYLTQLPSGELQVLPPQDWMSFPRDGVLVVSLGGLAGDRNLASFVPRLDLRPVDCKVEPARPGSDQEAWLRYAVNEARTLYARSRREMDERAHFAPFYACDKGALVLVVDLSTLLLGAHSVDFTVRQEGRHGALPGVAGCVFYLAEPMPVEIPNPEIYGQTPPVVVPAPPACRPAAPSTQGETNMSASTPKVRKDKFTSPGPPQQLTAGQLEGPEEVLSVAAAAAGQASAAAPAGTTQFPLAADVSAALGAATGPTLTPDALKALEFFGRPSITSGPWTRTRFVPSLDGGTWLMFYFVKTDGSLAIEQYYYIARDRFPDVQTRLFALPGQLPGVGCRSGTTANGLFADGEIVRIRNRANTADVRVVRLAAGHIALVPIFVAPDGTDIPDLRIIAKGGE